MRVELRAGDRGAVGQTDRRADRPRGARMVAGDHAHAHAGGVAGGDRLLDARARWVDERLEADQAQVAVVEVDRGGAVAGGEDQHAPAERGLAVDLRAPRRASSRQRGRTASGAPLT